MMTLTTGLKMYASFLIDTVIFIATILAILVIERAIKNVAKERITLSFFSKYILVIPIIIVIIGMIILEVINLQENWKALVILCAVFISSTGVNFIKTKITKKNKVYIRRAILIISLISWVAAYVSNINLSTYDNYAGGYVQKISHYTSGSRFIYIESEDKIFAEIQRITIPNNAEIVLISSNENSLYVSRFAKQNIMQNNNSKISMKNREIKYRVVYTIKYNIFTPETGDGLNDVPLENFYDLIIKRCEKS